MKKHLFISIVFSCVFGLAKAQQLPQYSSYMINNYVLNPAVTGSNNYYELKALNRYQWAGIKDAPRTFLVSLHGPFKKLNMGLGGFVFSDVTGPTSRTGGYLTYAYHLKLTSKLKLNLGLAAGFLQYRIDLSKVTLRQDGDPAAQQGGVLNSYQPDFNFGIYLNHANYFVGIAVNQIIGNRLKFYENQKDILSNLERHYLINGGYNFNFGKFMVQPSVMFKMEKNIYQFEGGLQARYNDLLWLGATYRHNDAISALAGLNIKDLILIGYAYDFATTRLKSYSNGTHEIMIGAKFGRIKSEEVLEEQPVPDKVPQAEPGEESKQEETKPETPAEQPK
ncbi:MAG: type IX secretion system membrane protein PorP/SprF [Bacteroidia bacterium]|nr:type IX secretion system membrane protein PorP/SprF [Bacteroidia bacterium]